MSTRDDLSDSLENYLEAILELEETQKVARAKEIADRLQIQRGSVTGGLKALSEKGYINYQPYSYITLTAKGKRIARDIAHRHAVIKEFLLKVLQIDPLTAETSACKMEHAIDPKTIERLVCFIEYIFTCPRAGQDWIQSFLNYCAGGNRRQNNCDECIEALRKSLSNPE
ncbi:metal-dependent transcriptional regulator [Desulfatitalea tepidiphila]|uniref:metal-dependent transcriptional regulator n=1 Tax=Desulfatitalea tepidiphila TaxID=1185843 RepID=UPI0006B528B0|nr:metal-dependent transcriptional regulator [Desulfatitalea tepidiphila]